MSALDQHICLVDSMLSVSELFVLHTALLTCGCVTSAQTRGFTVLQFQSTLVSPCQ